jgi:hypothetical protein
VDAAAGAGRMGLVAQQFFTPLLVTLIVPDFDKGLLEEVAQFQTLVIRRRKR